MGCRFIDGMLVTVANIYEYEGFTFEFHYYCGPMRVRKSDHEPTKRGMGRKFHQMLARWLKLTEKQRKKTQIYG